MESVGIAEQAITSPRQIPSRMTRCPLMVTAVVEITDDIIVEYLQDSQPPRVFP